MATEQIDEDWAPALVAGDEVILEDIVTRYEVTVFTLAMHLCNDEESAKKVVIDVFVRVAHEAHKHAEESLDSLIHRFTYDSALNCLLGQIGAHLDETVELGQLLGGAEDKTLPIC